MLGSTQLSINMFDRAALVAVPGLQFLDRDNRESVPRVGSGLQEQALALANRIASIVDSRQVPLPSALPAVTLPNEDRFVADDLLSTVARRMGSISRGTDLADPVMTSAKFNSTSMSRLSTVRSSNKSMMEAFAPAQGKERISASTEKGLPFPDTLRFLDVVLSPTNMPMPLDVAVEADRKAGMITPINYGILPSLGSMAGLPPTQISQAMMDAELPPLISMSKPVVVAVDKTRRGTSSEVPQARPYYKPATVLDMVIESRVSGSSDSDDWLTGSAESRNLPMTLRPSQNRSVPMPYLPNSSITVPDLQQTVVPILSSSSSRRIKGGAAVPQHAVVPSSTSASRTETSNGASGGYHSSQIVNLTGAVTMDGRRLGRLAASSQGREASLPARGPSRVNLRAVPIYPGMKVPS